MENKTLSSLPENIRDVFYESTLRIIEFTIINGSDLDPLVQDMVKKEFFRRYNSGITPLTRYEIDNAVYDEDNLTNLFKSALKSGSDLNKKLQILFFKNKTKAKTNKETESGIERVMQFIRRNLVLHKIPITYYSQTRKKEVLERLYDQLVDSQPDHKSLFDSFSQKVEMVWKLKTQKDKKNIQYNRLVTECFLWGLHVVENETVDLKKLGSAQMANEFLEYYLENKEDFSENNYAFYRPVIKRYTSTLRLFEQKTGLNLQLYEATNDNSRAQLKELMKDDDVEEKLDQLESLRLSKPDPPRTTIEDIAKRMRRTKFMVRPSYQRSEVINLSRASAIIESILLGISLPAVFIYKRKNGVSEVIDGQQRILTILGFIGAEYWDEEGRPVKTKNHEFRLRDIKILKEFNGKRFFELPDKEQEKILVFPLVTVTIEEKHNPSFDPIDLFMSPAAQNGAISDGLIGATLV